jgi:lysophospholipase L1-like esterase
MQSISPRVHLVARSARWSSLAALMVMSGACGGGPTTPPPPDAPTISCPASVTVRGVSSVGQSVTYPSAVAASGAAPVSVACVPASGASFTVGTTPVTCTATDALTRSAQCGFSVTLTPLLLSITNFLAFGDSFTEGQNGRFDGFGQRIVDVPNSYPTKLELLLNVEYPSQGITVANKIPGYGGKDVSSLLSVLPDDLVAVQPGALLLLGGYNNLLGKCPWPSAASAGCAAEITEVGAKLRECIRIAQEPRYGVKYVFVSTLTPPGPYLGGNDRRIAADAIIQTDARIAPMVSGEGAILVDPYPRFIGHESEYVDLDGLHLSPAGYQLLAETFFAAIKTAVTSTPAVIPF